MTTEAGPQASPMIVAAGPHVVELTVDPPLGERVVSLLGDLATQQRPDVEARLTANVASGGWALEASGTDIDTLGPAPHPDIAVDHLVTWLNQMAADDPDRLVLHAGMVARNGRVLVIAGHTGTGKSTLVAGLSRLGWEYLTDEVARIDTATATAAGYPKPITLKAGGHQVITGHEPDRGPAGLLSRWYLRPTDIGAAIGGPGTVAAVVVARHDPTLVAPIETTEVTGTAAVLALAAHRHPGDRFDLGRIAALAAAVPVVELTHRDVVATEATLAELAGSNRVGTPNHHEPGTDVTEPLGVAGSATGDLQPDSIVVANPSVDTVTCSDGLVVHEPVTGHLLAIDPIAAAVWVELDGRRSIAEIAAVLARRHRADRDRITRDLVTHLHDLAQRGVVIAPGLNRPR